VSDFIDDRRKEITDRLKELEPVVDEFNRLEAAVVALADAIGSTASHAASGAAAAVTRRRKKGPGRPRGSASRARKAAATSEPTATATATTPAKAKAGRKKPGCVSTTRGASGLGRRISCFPLATARR